MGFTFVLHTWDQQLRPYFHLHGLVASGALSFDGQQWIAGGRRFLFPVAGLSRMFRAKYLDGLTALWDQGQLELPPSLAHLNQPGPRRALSAHATSGDLAPEPCLVLRTLCDDWRRLAVRAPANVRRCPCCRLDCRFAESAHRRDGGALRRGLRRQHLVGVLDPREWERQAAARRS